MADEQPLDFSRKASSPPVSLTINGHSTPNGLNGGILNVSQLKDIKDLFSPLNGNGPLDLNSNRTPAQLRWNGGGWRMNDESNREATEQRIVITEPLDFTTPSPSDDQHSPQGSSKSLVLSGSSSSRKRGMPLPEELKDEAYWERRRKNNEAAKRSRDSRRAKENEIAIKAAFLEQENLMLRVEVAALKSETAKLRHMLAYTSNRVNLDLALD